ncbi:flavin reductase [Clostridia bacterium]|nr:flavin reductase [Clostridia bacterium]
MFLSLVNTINRKRESEDYTMAMIDLSKLEPRHAHDLLASSMIPRPIAWVSTISASGVVNLAPFSFFTGVSWNPPLVAFSPVNRADGTKKDTVRNIEEVPEFVIHIVSEELLKPMEKSAKPLRAGEDVNIAGITLVPSETVKPLRIREAKIAYECSLEKIERVTEGADAGNLIIGRVKLLHALDELIADGRNVDYRVLDPLGRLSGNAYCTVENVIESETN